jgi:hypothetical protein
MDISYVLTNGLQFLDPSIKSNDINTRMIAVNKFLNFYISEMAKVGEPRKREYMKAALYVIFGELLEMVRNPSNYANSNFGKRISEQLSKIV